MGNDDPITISCYGEYRPSMGYASIPKITLEEPLNYHNQLMKYLLTNKREEPMEPVKDQYMIVYFDDKANHAWKLLSEYRNNDGNGKNYPITDLNDALKFVNKQKPGKYYVCKLADIISTEPKSLLN